MAIILKKTENNSLFGLWKIDETEEELLQKFSLAPLAEQDRLNAFKNINKRIERIAARLLIYDLLGKPVIIEYDDYGKPFIKGDERSISISHTTGMIAVQICPHNAGIDIEKISERIAKIAHKFLNPTELNQIDLNNQLLHTYAHWCAKETVYKIYGKKRLDFKEHIYVEPFNIKNTGNISVSLKKQTKESFLLDYFIFEDDSDKYMIVKYCQ